MREREKEKTAQIPMPLFICTDPGRPDPNFIADGSCRTSWRVPVFTTVDAAKEYGESRNSKAVVKVIRNHESLLAILRIAVDCAPLLSWVVIDPPAHARHPTSRRFRISRLLET